jgi:cytochrome b subunit of formate dehydrogenase
MEEKIEPTESNPDGQPKASTGHRYFVRLTYAERMQHGIFVSCFIILAATGLMLEVPDETVMQVLGEARAAVFYWRGIVHRIAGTVLILTSLYHICYLVFARAGRRWFVDMLPRFSDLTGMVGNMLYYIGARDEPPKFDRFYYKQKIEYGALVAGSTIMIITGLILWTEVRWSRFVLDLSTIVHGMEAILACLAIMIWHLYEVHLRPHKYPMSKVWINGLIHEEEMKEEFPLYYDKIMADPRLQEIYVKTEEQRG